MSRPYMNTRSRAGAVSVWASSLPHAILVQALRLLPRDARARCACVCRAWRDAAADPDALASLWFEDGGHGPRLNDKVLARLCAHAGAALREVLLVSDACDTVTAASALAALRQGGCAGVQRLVLHTGDWYQDSDMLSAEEAQQLAATCPALEHAACVVRCESAEDVSTVGASLPGPLKLFVRGLDAARAASQLPARMAALVLRDCTLDGQCVAALCDALRTTTTLKTLHLVGADAGDAVAIALGSALRTNATLKKLHLGGNGIADVGAVALGEALRTNTTLTALYLDSNRIGDAGAASLADALRTNTTLRTLFLSSNGIGDAGAAALGETLRTNATLESLFLKYNHIGDDGAVSLASALATNATLTTLWLDGNRIGDAGTAALVEALRANTTLKELTMQNDVNLVGRG